MILCDANDDDNNEDGRLCARIETKLIRNSILMGINWQCALEHMDNAPIDKNKPTKQVQ